MDFIRGGKGAVPGHKPAQRHQGAMSALPLKADIANLPRNVRFVPQADIEPAPALDAAAAVKKEKLLNPAMVEKLQSFRHGRNVRRRSSQAK